MRSKYGYYEEYHTSHDNFNLVTANGLEGGFEVNRLAIEAIENNCIPLVKVVGEPQMGKRNLFPEINNLVNKDLISSKGRRQYDNIKDESFYYHLMMNVLSYSDGLHSLLEIAETCNVPIWNLYSIIKILEDNNLIELKDNF
tara:strand:- start:76 stop:501 length:426 start_codon:yes stop_codon:yes gene_type:complete